MTLNELAHEAFLNEIDTIPLKDENRQFRALTNAYRNASVYADTHDYKETALRREIAAIAKEMGITLCWNCFGRVSK